MSDVILRLQHVSLGYGERRVIDGASLAIHAGEFWFLLGTNGAGKTSFVRAVMQLLTPLAGELWLHPQLARREHVGFVPQRCDLNPTLPTTVREFVILGLVGLQVEKTERGARLAAALATAGLQGRELESYWSLSGGLRQRALIARALIRRPSLLILDEPTTGLDPATEDGILGLVAALNAEQQCTVLFVTHDVAVATRYATHVALFHGGHITSGTARDILTPESLHRIYALPADGRPPSSGTHRGDHS